MLCVLALPGGYSHVGANKRLARTPALIATFSRALVEDLGASHDDDAFDAALDASINGIFRASIA